MIPNCCFGNKFLWELYIDFLLLIEMVTCCVFKVEFTMYKEDNEDQESDEDQPWIIFGEYLPMGYVVLCFFNLWFSYRIFRVLSKRKLILTFGLVYRTLSLLGKYFSKKTILSARKSWISMSVSFLGLVFGTYITEFWLKNLYQNPLPMWDHLYQDLITTDVVISVLEVLSIPAWIYIYKEIKRQSTYGPISSEPEGQPIDIQTPSNSSRRTSSYFSI